MDTKYGLHRIPSALLFKRYSQRLILTIISCCLFAFSGYSQIAYDVSTATFTQSKILPVVNPEEVNFSTDGLKMFVHNIGRKIHEYPLASAFDVSTIGTKTAEVAFGDGSSIEVTEGILFNPDGTRVYDLRRDGDVYEYTLSIGFDLTSTLTPLGNSERLVFSGIDFPAAHGMTFNNDGTKLYILARNSISPANYLFQFNLSTAYDVSTGTFIARSSKIEDLTGVPYNGESFYGIAANANSTKFFVNNSTTILEFALVGDVSTTNFTYVRSIANGDSQTQLRDVFFNSDGSKFYTSSYDTRAISEYSIPVPSPPVFTSTAVTTIPDDQLYEYFIRTTDTEENIVTVTGTTLPSWLSISQTYEIKTWAGSSIGSNNGTRTSARFRYPSAVDVDSHGNVFVFDQGNAQIRKITPEGVVTTFAGSTSGYADGTGTSAMFSAAEGMIIDSNDNLYVADTQNNRIRKVTSLGVVTTLAGSGAPNSNMDGTGTEARVNAPKELTVDDEGNVYFSAAQKLRKITPEGVTTTFFHNTDILSSWDVMGFHDDFIYVLSFGRVFKVSLLGEVTFIAGNISNSVSMDGTGTDAGFSFVLDMTFDADHNIYLTAPSGGIRKVTQGGVVTTILGTAGLSQIADGIGVAGGIRRGNGITFDHTRNLFYITDYDDNSHVVRTMSTLYAVKGNPLGHIGDHTLSLLATDEDGGTASQDFTIGVTATPSSAIIARKTPTDASTSLNSVSFQVTFDEDVQNVDKSDFELSGTASGTIGDLIETTASSVFEVPVTGITGLGELDLDFASGQNIIDGFSTAFAGDISSEETYTMLGTSVAIKRKSPLESITRSTALKFELTFSEPVQNVDKTDFELSGTATGLIGDLIELTAGTVFEVPVTVTSNGTVDLDFNVNQDISDGINSFVITNISEEETYDFFANSVPVFAPTQNFIIDAGTTFTYSPSLTDTDNDDLSLTAPTLPSWLTLIIEEGLSSEITTLAGSGSSTEVNGTGTGASFGNPFGMVQDANRNLYVTVQENQKIKKITPEGVVSDFVSTGLSEPYGLTIDNNGNLYVVDGYVIKKVTPAGVVSTFSGSGTQGIINSEIPTSVQYQAPKEIVFVPGMDNDHFALYVTEVPAGQIREIAVTPTSNIVSSVAYQLFGLTGLTVDASGILYVATTQQLPGGPGPGPGPAPGPPGPQQQGISMIMKITPGVPGAPTLYAQQSEPVTSMVSDSKGALYVGTASSILKFETGQGFTTLFSAGCFQQGQPLPPEQCPFTVASFNNITGLYLNENDALYIADNGNHKIDRVESLVPRVTGTAPAYGVYNVVLRADDSFGGVTDQPFTITINDEIDPVLTSGITESFAENGIGTVYSVVATDLNDITYSLGTGNDEALFAINGGLLTFINSPDFETPGGNNADNTYVINVIASDGVNNVDQNVTITVTDVVEDITGPVLASSNPADEGTDFSGSTLTFTFDENIVKGTGRISVFDAADDSEISGAGVGSARITVSGNTATFDLINPLPLDKAVYVRIPVGAFKDALGNTFNGMLDNTTLNFASATTPKLTSSNPADDAIDVTGTTIALTFDRNIVKGTGRISLFNAADDTEVSGAGVGSGRVTIANNVATFDLINALPENMQVYLRVPPAAFKDANDRFFLGITDNTSLNYATPTTPQLVSSTPADEATNVAGTTLTFTFDRNVVTGTGRISVYDAADDTEITGAGVGSARVSITNNVMTFDLVNPLPLNKQVYVKIPASALKDGNDSFFLGIMDKTTLNFAAPTSPQLVSSTPADEATDVGGTTLTFTFDRNVVKGTGRISIYDAADDTEINGAGVGSARISITDNVVTYDLVNALPLDKQVYIKIPGSAFKDVNNVFYQGILDNTSLNFASPTTPQLVSSNPADETTEFTGTSLVLTFDRNLTKGTGRMSIYDAADDTEINGAGVGSARVTIVNNVVTMDLINPLPLNKQVYVTIPGGAFKDASNKFYKGIFDKTTLNFSSQSSPQLVSSSPADEAIDFTGTTVTLTFDRNVVKGTGRISVLDAVDDSEVTGAGVGSTRITVIGNVVTFDLINALPTDKQVYLKVPGAAFKGASDVFYQGILDKTTLNFASPTTPQITATNPLDGVTDFSGTTITFTFDRNVIKGTGRLGVYNAADDTELTGAGVGSTRVTVTNNVVNFNLINPLPAGTSVYVKVPASAFKDVSNRFYKGMLDKTTFNFTAVLPPALSNPSNALGELTLSESSSVTLYPNPATNVITLDLSEIGEEPAVRITDATGAQKFSIEKVQQSKLSIDVSQYAGGMYIAIIKTSEGQLIRKKFMIRR